MSEQFGWSEWIEFKAGVPCPIAWAQADQYEVKWDADDSLSILPPSWEAVRFWRSVEDPFHYRYSLSAAPAGFVPPGAEKPWVPEQVPGFGPWVEHVGDELPITDSAVCCVLLQEERVKKSEVYGASASDRAGEWSWHSGGMESIVAYAIKLEDQPTQEQVEATQKPETPEADASEDAKAANRPMSNRDDAGIESGTWTRFNARQAWQKPTDPPGFMVRDVRSSDGLLTVREADHRFGLWE